MPVDMRPSHKRVIGAPPSRCHGTAHDAELVKLYYALNLCGGLQTTASDVDLLAELITTDNNRIQTHTAMSG